MAQDRRKTDTLPNALSQDAVLRILEERGNAAREELASKIAESGKDLLQRLAAWNAYFKMDGAMHH